MYPLYKVFIPEEGSLNGIGEILRSGQLTSGTHLNHYEEELRNFIGNPYVVTTSNSNFATMIALLVAGIGPCDEIIASPIACLASTQPLTVFGSKLVWADIDPNTGTLDPDSVRKKITQKTKAIVHYHWCGYPGHIAEINQLGRKAGITVIDDACESFGAEYRGQRIGNVGTPITLFALNSIRLPHCIEGGALAFDNDEAFRLALQIRDYGIDRSTFRDEYGEISPDSDIRSLGFGAKLSEINAFIGRSVLASTSNLLDRQRRNASVWNQVLSDSNAISLESPGVPNYWVYSMRTAHSQNVMLALRQAGFYSSRVHMRNDHYSRFGGLRDLPGVASFAKSQICVPSGWWVDHDELSNVRI